MYLDVEIKKLKAFLRQNFELQSQSNFVRQDRPPLHKTGSWTSPQIHSSDFVVTSDSQHVTSPFRCLLKIYHFVKTFNLFLIEI